MWIACKSSVLCIYEAEFQCQRPPPCAAAHAPSLIMTLIMSTAWSEISSYLSSVHLSPFEQCKQTIWASTNKMAATTNILHYYFGGCREWQLFPALWLGSPCRDLSLALGATHWVRFIQHSDPHDSIGAEGAHVRGHVLSPHQLLKPKLPLEGCHWVSSPHYLSGKSISLLKRGGTAIRRGELDASVAVLRLHTPSPGQSLLPLGSRLNQASSCAIEDNCFQSFSSHMVHTEKVLKLSRDTILVKAHHTAGCGLTSPNVI